MTVHKYHGRNPTHEQRQNILSFDFESGNADIEDVTYEWHKGTAGTPSVPINLSILEDIARMKGKRAISLDKLLSSHHPNDHLRLMKSDAHSNNVVFIPPPPEVALPPEDAPPPKHRRTRGGGKEGGEKKGGKKMAYSDEESGDEVEVVGGQDDSVLDVIRQYSQIAPPRRPGEKWPSVGWDPRVWNCRPNEMRGKKEPSGICCGCDLCPPR